MIETQTFVAGLLAGSSVVSFVIAARELRQAAHLAERILTDIAEERARHEHAE